ncbi:LOW QUALITY PROTEIN: glutamate receptor 2.7 [Ricinus communis]|uniref:Glutamate receptor n=1 Tax=Ricinus communis TaxID=3988 RepID=B9RXC1_RICCO|nr:LOW QUALITY PROTEIN: glutamate receptor 2.7 [Ricinus communis]EEF44026.1 glutamate receptor 2 plant, putative [Ricinus communis]|eukprot:XP_002518390.1 glutamate receptor 2.7 [Ricinus communis]
MDIIQLVLFSLLGSLLVDGSTKANGNKHVKTIIGAIVDERSRIGKEERIAMEIAVDDFNSTSNQSFILHIKDSRGEPFNAALAAQDLINTQEVQVILGPQTWEEVSLVADISSQNSVPLLSFADNIPKRGAERWPFLLQASPNKYAQMKAVAAIVQSWNWFRVTVLYEDSMVDGVIPHLYDALRDVGAEISRVIALSPFDSSSSSSLSEDLEGLKQEDCRVFVVHASLSLAVRLYERAKEMNMMEEDYVWITTDPFTSLVHSINSSIISSMQGIVGVKSYLPEAGQYFQDFYNRFRSRFNRQYPEENNSDPGIFAVQAYDAIRMVALATHEGNYRGKDLLERVLLTDFHGLSGKVQFINMKAAPAYRFQIINVVGKLSYRELGFWSNGLGFSKTIDDGATRSSSMDDLGPVIWPGGSRHTPRGWSLPTSSNPLKIGVPAGSGYKEYVKVENSLGNKPSFTGFAIEVFEETLKRLPFNLPYNFIPFNGTYNELVEQIHLKEFDAVVGDVAIVSNRYQHAEFTHPYTETGLVKIIPTRPTSCSAWLFLKPFTKLMWVLIAAINIYNGFVVWLIERNHCPELKGSIANQIGVLFWLSFTTLFSLHGEKLHSNLSRMSMVTWLFMALVITQTYTANLASVLTVRRLEPDAVNANAMVGYCRGSFVQRYLVEVLNYQPQRLKNYTTIEEYGQALKSKEIAAAYLEAPLANLFLAKYCKGFAKVGPTYKVGGFGFAFRRGSPLLASMNKALLEVSESGKLLELEDGIIVSNDQCKDMELEDENPSLGPGCFRVLFIITGGTSSIALLLLILHKVDSVFKHTSMWKFMWDVLKHLSFPRNRFVRKVSDSEIHGNTFSNTSNTQSGIQIC